MSLKRILLDGTVLETLLTDCSHRTLTDAVHGLIKHQVINWPDFAKAREQLHSIQTRKVFLTALTVTLQFNPGRIISAQAPVDKESVRKRPCFLCLHSLPGEQRALLYQDDWLILNNPAPLFYDHLVISHQNHSPQRILEALPAMIALVKDLEFHFEAFYNGPVCGASAPDHVHFQMCPTGEIPLVSQIVNLIQTDTGNNQLIILKEKNQEICLSGYIDNRSIFICKAVNPDFLYEKLTQVVYYLREATSGTDEPMVNLIIAGDGKFYYGILFPRKAHRPSCYFKNESHRMVVSPGAVDVGGLIILPRREDYAKIEKEIILSIFQEVCHGPEIFSKLTL